MTDSSETDLDDKIKLKLLLHFNMMLLPIVSCILLASLVLAIIYHGKLEPRYFPFWICSLTGVSLLSLLSTRRDRENPRRRPLWRMNLRNVIHLSLLGISFCLISHPLLLALEGIDQQVLALLMIVILLIVVFLASPLFWAAFAWNLILTANTVFLTLEDGYPLLSPYSLLPLLLGAVISFLTLYIHRLFYNGFKFQILDSERNLRFRMLVEQSPLSIVITDIHGRIIQVNRKLEEVSGYCAEELIGQNPSLFQSGRTPKETFEEMWRTLGEGNSWQGEFINRRKDNEIYIEKANVGPGIDSTGTIRTYIGIKEDITEQKKAQETILEQNGLIKMLLQDYEEQSDNWLWQVDGDLNLLHISGKIARLIPGDFLEKPLELLLQRYIIRGDGESETLYGSLMESFGRGASFPERELKIRFGGEVMWLGVRGTANGMAPGGRKGWRGVGRVITEKKRMEEELYRRANFDEQTGLPNRGQFKRSLSQSLSTDFDLRRGVLGIVHVRELSEVRTDFGSQRYGRVLVALIGLLKDHLGEGSMAGRLNENEFIFWVASDGAIPIENIHRLSSRINAPLEVGNETYRFIVNIGLAYYPDDATSQQSLYHAADLALKNSIDSIRRHVMRYRRSFSEDYQRNMMMLSDFQTALQAEQFLLYYQPQVFSSDRSFRGAEALVRWNHPLLGFVSPDQFIPLAEKSRFIKELGEWIIYRACRDAAGWGGDKTLSVNISAVQLQDMTRLKYVLMDALQKSGMAPERLILEITESVLIGNINTSGTFLKEHQGGGIKIALDDFGTGYSSLAYLAQLSIDELKIDQAFIKSIGVDHENEEIIRTIIHLGRKFRFSLIAEGVETEEQYEFLRGLGCDHIQGYLFGKPEPLSRISDFTGPGSE